MKKIVTSSIVLAALFVAGCSTKAPEVDMKDSSNVVKDYNTKTNDMSMSDADRLNAMINSLQNQVKSVYFDFDKFNVSSSMYDVVSKNASLFNANGAQNLNIKVEGNCDEWGTDEYNYALGLKRAKAVKDALVRSGVNADRISVVSYGEGNPVCTSKGKSCDAQNRRADFKILP